MVMKSTLKIVLDPFCYRQFEASAGRLFINYDREAFNEVINEHYLKVKDEGGLKDGYAPFCKHLFVENFTSLVSEYIKITKENEGLIRSGYQARRENELAVLNRWIDIQQLEEQTGQPVPKAKYLDIILYSKAQIFEENKALGQEDQNKDIDYDYAIVAAKSQDDDHETPMQPITIMRNALGKEQGGSGVTLDAEKYKESVKFWQEHISIN
ncbi:UNKNOWN [Stylonychia lemnae]|uniref:Flagellar associated protein n=1 Tax=Stylonychia lemnae TaxID=5949 RepID=A0A078A1D9_STYLE|nr:UNKNOWN [Stylonychia lemnae]|eukprot:CDW75910.1 UNKNOWN [Stylonychia lemnae]